jgi:5-methyltetrahydropteroyltriglutamate--homocysteine methyltransferase
MGLVTQGLIAETITHICYGDFVNAYDSLIEIPVDQIDIETANSDYHLLDLMKARPMSKSIGLGVVDVHSHRVESVEEVVAGIERALDVFPPERIYIDPDCGLKTRTREESAAKLQVMMKAVRHVRRERGISN